ncbi:hypothetical protein GCM10022243_65220 [Saccharothrix violaceirubra]|uniref:Uncharacterized protein n=1 Tax=Saccharothrix violaceirubra TaxID=413306 RepID=A0A7W7T9D0_9PSEU|nr:AAA family ATPase [Saccharothrix violaceirubra]MBB4968992.1 hypothetical protein [Saccharothrix violaceirubra]
MVWSQFFVSVLSGVAVSLVLASLRVGWTHRRVPLGLSRAVTRRSYLATILTLSRDPGLERIEGVIPSLRPSTAGPLLPDIQAAWARVDARFVVSEAPESLAAGAELAGKGVEVRVKRSLLADDLSYHVFGGERPQVVVNHRDGRRDRPSRLVGPSPTRIFQAHFADAWRCAVPIESVLADEALGDGPDRAVVAERLRELRRRYALSGQAEAAVVRHLAFLHSARVVFVTGLPGAGKSLVRNRLAEKLGALRLQVDQQGDYAYIFSEFVKRMIRLEEDSTGFVAVSGGAFDVDDERRLEPALRRLSRQVLTTVDKPMVTLVEFARADVVAALLVFGEEILSRAQVIHVRASAARRAMRLEARAQPARVQVDGLRGVTVELSDNHLVPATAASSRYVGDDAAALAPHRVFDGRLHHVDNELDDPVGLDRRLDGFVDDVIRPYRTLVG